MPYTTIQISSALKSHLEEYKEHPRETYNELIERIIQKLEGFAPQQKINKTIIKEIEAAKKEKPISTEQLIKELELEK